MSSISGKNTATSFVVSHTKRIAAAPDAIFAILADPSRHREIDGSGTVRNAAGDAPVALSKGATFQMSMKLGVPYKITNTVVEFEPNRLIGWRHFGGHVWRYELSPVPGEQATDVTESFDWSGARSHALIRLIGAPKRNSKAIIETLERLAARFA